MMSIKLDTRALENLLQDDDGTIKLELQQSVVEEFSRRHIKSILNDRFFDTKMTQLKREAGGNIEKLFGNWITNSAKRKFELNPQIKDMIRLQSKTAVTTELDRVEEHVKEIYKDAANRIKERYESRMKAMERNFKNYAEQLEKETETVRAQLVTDKVDVILRDHIKDILAETFAPKIKE